MPKIYHSCCWYCLKGSSKKKEIKERDNLKDVKQQMEDEPDRRAGPVC